MQKKEYSVDYCGKPLKVEISDLADQANGSVLVKYGETTVFATAVMSGRQREGLDYFPLSVDYEERFYAAGMILGSRFIRREARPSESAILTSRLIDRTIRPLFNKKIRNEVQVVVLALSIDGKNDPDIPAIFAASLALGISDIPWDGPVGAVRMGYLAGLEAGLPSGSPASKFVANPTYEEREKSSLDLVVCGKDGKINMIETIASEINEKTFVQAMEAALPEIEKMETFQKGIIKEIGREKAKIDIKEIPAEMTNDFNKKILSRLDEAIFSRDKGGLSDLKSAWLDMAAEEFGGENRYLADELYEEKINEIIHQEILQNEKRPDGRKLDELRDLSASVGTLPILHGSGLFFRGGTHILSVVTLGGPKDVLWIQGMEIQAQKHFLHHYNFPPFSTGETGRMGFTGRREIGHGALAEKALMAIIPDREFFPYTIRVVSEAMASNGSTSMGSVCASSLAMMDAGVPIKTPAAGIAMGLMMEHEAGNMKHESQEKSFKFQVSSFKILTDIQGPEDHHGDMDLKCAGTKNGITAAQMDVKVEGIPVEILSKALDQAKKARLEILDVMARALPEPRKELSAYAPRVIKIKIDPEKIGVVIGPGGKMINSIIEQTGAEIDIEQDGTVFITGRNHEDVDKAKATIEGLTHEFQVDEIVEGPVSRIFDFGAMVEIGPMQEGMIHISELTPFRVNKVTDAVNIGDRVKAKVISIDERGRVNLSIKRMDPNYDSSKDTRRSEDRNRNQKRNNNFRKR